MRFIYNKSLDPYYNLAAEEYLIKNSPEDIFMLWRNDNTIVVGRNQNTLAEINYDYVKENNINVVRRMSGGGAVFHDLGNINFTFILKSEDDFSNYEKFTAPIISFLSELGVKAELKGRNDLVIDGKKFSGNAQFMYKNRILHHGTLLYSASCDKLTNALRISEDKIKTKGIKSISSRVTNISEHLSEKISPEEFIEKLRTYMTENIHDCTEYDLENDREEIEKLKNEKYSTWDWNYGYSPKYSFNKRKRFSGGCVEVSMNVDKDGIIEDIKISGDFFSKNDIAELENILKGHHHNAEEIEKLLRDVKVENYIASVTYTDLLTIIF